MSPLLILGAGGHAKVIAAAAMEAGREVTGFFDDDPERWGSAVLGVPVHGSLDSASGHEGEIVIGIGDNRRRIEIAALHPEARWASIVHPTAWVHASVEIGPGAVVMAGAIVQPGTSIGAHAIVNTASSVDHDCELGEAAHVAPGARLAGAVRLGKGALFGIGAVAVPGVQIGEWAVIGAGAAVIHDVPANAIFAGVPARRIAGKG